jgi:perosamine synthetase
MMAVSTRHIPISKVVIGEDEIQDVVEVLRSGNLREGPVCAAFEREFAEAVGARFVLTTSSGTAALQMAYQALLQPGDEVLVPAFTFYATASMVVAVGGIPVFCDVDPHTFTLDIQDAEHKLSKRTRAIAPVHLFGNAASASHLRDFADAHRLAIVWDAAQAHGTRYGGRDVGSYGDVATYSFYPSKNMTTGEGGMVTTDREDLAESMKLLRSQGQPHKYWHTTLGYNFRMTDIQAAIGRGQLRRLSEWVVRRRANARYLRDRLTSSGLLFVQQEEANSEHSYHQFTVLLPAAHDREAFMARLRENGVESAIHYPTPLHQQPAFEAYSRGLSLPVSEDASRRVVSLPVHPHLSESDLEYIAENALQALSASN